MRSLFAVAAFASVLLIPSVGSASILFDTGVDPGVTSPNISDGYSDAAHFTLTDDSILDSASLYIWMNNPNVPAALDWAIQSSDGSTSYSSGTAAALTSDFFAVARGYDIYHSTFDLGDLSLSAGNYRLYLSNCGTGATGCGWGVVSPSGSDVQYLNNAFNGNVGTFAFSIQGDLAAPEPSTWMMMGTALIGLTGAAIRKRRA